MTESADRAEVAGAVELDDLRERLDRQSRLIEATVAAPERGERLAHLLVETARQLGETLDPQRVYDRFHDLLADTVPHDGVVVSSYDAEANLIRCDYAWADGKRLDATALPPLTPAPEGEGMQSHVLRTGRTLLANDVAERVESGRGTFYNVDAEGRVRKVPEAGPVSTRAAIMVPVKHEGRVVGIVQLMSDRESYTSDHVEFVEALVAQMSAAVRNARLYEAAQAEIAARARAERGLRESEERFRATFENAPVGIAHVGLDGSWLRVNDRLCEIVGYPREELLERTFQDITHPDDLDADLAEGRRLRAGEIDAYAVEKRYVRKDASAVWANVTVSMLRNEAGEPLYFISVVEDVSARKRAEEERRRFEAAAEAARAVAREREQATRVLAAVGDGIVLVDHAGIVRHWNPAAERILGLPANEVVGRALEAAVPSWHEVRERLSRPEEDASAETVPIEIGEHELWLSVVAVQSADGFVYAFRDETHERSLERAKSEFIATVSHELRTPLAAVYGAAQTLLRQDVDVPIERRRRLLEMIATQSDRLVRIAEEVLLASKLESGDLPIASEPVDVVEIARETVDAMRSRLPGGMSLELLSPPDLPAARGDTGKLRQVLLNLVDNAIKYSPDGGSVTVAAERLDASVRVEVRDRGLGIPAPEQDRIFEKFYRVDPLLTRAPGGTGLGLYICRELVQRMDGRIGVESSEGSGSVFFVELPLAAS